MIKPYIAFDWMRHHGTINTDKDHSLAIVFNDETTRILAQMNAMTTLMHLRVAHLFEDMREI